MKTNLSPQHRSVYQSAENALINSSEILHLAELKIRMFKHDLILMYHSVESEKSGYRYAVAPENFAKHLDFLQQRFKLVSLEEIFNTTDSRTARVAVTFDDAHEDFYINVYPLLSSRNIPATVFVPTLFIGTGKQLLESMGFPYRKGHMNWDQMREISASGLISFECHTHSHLDCVSSLETLKEDVEMCSYLLEKNLGRRPKYFAYPHGRYNSATNEILLKFGFHKLLTSDSAYIKGNYTEGRFDIYDRTESMPYFKLTVAGLMTNNVKQLVRHFSAQ